MSTFSESGSRSEPVLRQLLKLLRSDRLAVGWAGKRSRSGSHDNGLTALAMPRAENLVSRDRRTERKFRVGSREADRPPRRAVVVIVTLLGFVLATRLQLILVTIPGIVVFTNSFPSTFPRRSKAASRSFSYWYVSRSSIVFRPAVSSEKQGFAGRPDR